MLKSLKVVLLAVCGMVAHVAASAQECLERPEPIFHSTDTSICPTNIVNLWASVNSLYPTSLSSISYQTLSDDIYSPVVNIGFDFEFYGVTYNQLIISSNNYISFVLSNAGMYSAWSIPGPAPSGSTPQLAIMCPWQDVNPSSGGQVRYQTVGTAPNRIFVVEFCNIPMFSCTGQLFTDQILLYESCNIIETHIVSKTLCSSWNDGKAIHGLSKNASTAHIVPGRNAPGHWTALMDGYRFTPDPTDDNNYILQPIPYNPILMGLDETNIKWYEGLTSTVPIATGPTVTVEPTEPTQYVVEVAAGGTCNGVVKRYIINVDFNSNFYDTTYASICSGEIYDHHGDLLHSSGTYTKHVTYPMSCDTFWTVHLTVNPTPVADIETSKSSICEGDHAVISATQPGTASLFQWYKDDVLIPGATASSYQAYEGGAYRVIMKTDKGCVDTSRQITIHLNPNPEVQIASVGTEYSNLCIGDTIELNVVDPKVNYDYRWSPEKYFRYIQGYRQASVKAIVTEPTYLVVRVMNEFGCNAADSIYIDPKPCCDTQIPTAFSPNGDGLNDYFNIKLQPGQLVVTFQVFDRFGNMVYDNNAPNKGWNGLINNTGAKVLQGVYYYRLVYSCTDKQNYEIKGDVTLVE